MEYDSKILIRGVRTFLRIRVQLYVRRPLKQKKIMLAFEYCTYVIFKYERLIIFCFFCGCLGHNDSFCQIRMIKWEEPVEMSWDLSLQSQFKRVAAMNSVWLIEEEDRGMSKSYLRYSGLGRESGDGG